MLTVAVWCLAGGVSAIAGALRGFSSTLGYPRSATAMIDAAFLLVVVGAVLATVALHK